MLREVNNEIRWNFYGKKKKKQKKKKSRKSDERLDRNKKIFKKRKSEIQDRRYFFEIINGGLQKIYQVSSSFQ